MQASKPRAQTQNYDSFLEAFKDLGRNTVSEVIGQGQKMFTDDIPSSFGLKADLSPNESFSLSDLKRAEVMGEKRAENRLGSQLVQQREQERQNILRQEQQNKMQIISIQEEIKKIAKTMGEFVKEVQVATMQAPVNPGVYHRNFFTSLRTFISGMRLRIQESKNWLASSNARAAKKGKSAYWTQAQRSGTKFTLSSERYMVTSTG